MKPTEKRRGTMASTIKCLSVLELLAREPFEFGLFEISASLDAPKTSTHRLVATLMEAGFVEQDGDSRRYRLTGKALWVGTGFLRHSRVYRASFPVMQDLAGKTEGMVHLGLWDNDAVLYLHTVGHPSSLYLFANTGERRAVHATALGKVMLAYRSPEDLERIFSKEVERYTDKTITSLDAMRRELETIRDQGYALDDEEGVRGLRCLAAAIRDHKGQVVAAISMSAPTSVLAEDNRPHYASLVQEAAIRASVHAGYRPLTTNVSSLLTRPYEAGETSRRKSASPS